MKRCRPRPISRPAFGSQAHLQTPGTGCVNATVVRRRNVRHCSRKFRGIHAAQTTNRQSGYVPTAARARTHACAVAPVVSTSSTKTTCAFAAAAGSGTAHTRPRRLRSRSRADRPAESRTPHQTRRHGNTWQPSSDRAADRAHRTTGSPPRRRAETRRLGEGTSIKGRPGVRNSASPAASARPSGPARSRLPRSFAASTACRAGPRYRLSAQHGTPGSLRGRIRTGGPSRVRAQPAHHSVPGRRQPPHSGGRTRSRSVPMPASVPPGTDIYRQENRPTKQRPGSSVPRFYWRRVLKNPTHLGPRIPRRHGREQAGPRRSCAEPAVMHARPGVVSRRHQPPCRTPAERQGRDTGLPRGGRSTLRSIRCSMVVSARLLPGAGMSDRPYRHRDAGRRSRPARRYSGRWRQPGSTGTASAPRPGTSRQ